MNETSSARVDRGKLAGGLILLAVGILFLADRFDLADFGWMVHRYWPMIIVAVGIPKLFDTRTVWGGLWLIAVGAWLQATVLHVNGLTFSNSWPLLLIALGGGMVARSLFEAATGRRISSRENGRER